MLNTSKPSPIIVNVGLENLKTLVITYLRSRNTFENLSSKWMTALIVSFLLIITLIHKLVLLWIDITGRIQCAACKSLRYTKRGSFSRRWQYSPLGIEYTWNVPRFQCSVCQNSFSSFTNTAYSYYKVPPALLVLRPVILVISKLRSISLVFHNNTSQKGFSLALTSFLRRVQFLKQFFELPTHIQDPRSMMFFLRNCLTEKQRRLFLGLFALNLPRGSMKQLQQLTGTALKTIRRGKQELRAQHSSSYYSSPIRQGDGGRSPKITDPRYEVAVLQLIEDETAGDPMTGLKWTRRSLRKLSSALHKDQLNLAPSSIARILHGNNYSPRVNSQTTGILGWFKIRRDYAGYMSEGEVTV